MVLQFLIYLLNMHKWDSWERRWVRGGAEDWCTFVANKDLCQCLSGLRTPLGEFALLLLLVDILPSKSAGACVVDSKTKVDETNNVYFMQINLNWRVVHYTEFHCLRKFTLRMRLSLTNYSQVNAIEEERSSWRKMPPNSTRNETVYGIQIFCGMTNW